MKAPGAVFVDTGAWIALALTRDPLHARAVDTWERLLGGGAKLYTSIPVALETFTFLDRHATRDVALAWKDSLNTIERFRLVDCKTRDLDEAWRYFRRRDLHKLSAVDATSFVIMKRERIMSAFTFDHHFRTAGFRIAE
jgi:predicted nucleic acid-binding protein